MNEPNKRNGNCIITMNVDHIKNLSNLSYKKLDYFEIIFDKYLTQNINLQVSEIDIPSHLLLSLCNVIAISGDSGSGKTTLSNSLSALLNEDVLQLETDRYHKWERGHESYTEYTHLNPESNYLEKMEDDLYNLRIGNDIYRVDYDHNTGKFTQEKNIKPKGNIILCGLHTMWSTSLQPMLNMKIYMDTDHIVKTKWKIERDVNTRGKTERQVHNEIKKRQTDYENYIKNQRQNADMIINFHEKEDTLKCDCIICRNLN
jgi:uridine kinase